MRFLNKIDDVKEFDAFKGKKHFGVECSCGEACVSAVSDEQAKLIERDPVIFLSRQTRLFPG